MSVIMYSLKLSLYVTSLSPIVSNDWSSRFVKTLDKISLSAGSKTSLEFYKNIKKINTNQITEKGKGKEINRLIITEESN